jgi:hypothetical protein
MGSFIPDMSVSTSTVPYFEDNAKTKIPGRGTEKTVDQLQREIVKLLQQLGAFSIQFVQGKHEGEPLRYGFQIQFMYASARGRYDCAALPMRRETPARKQQALAQCLYLVRNKFEALVYAHTYEPEGVPLLPYLLDNRGQTVTEALRAGGMLPLLGNGAK